MFIWMISRSNLSRIAALAFTVLLLAACEEEEKSSSGGGSNEDAVKNTISLDSESGQTNKAQTAAVELDAFKDFNCSSNWTDRDGGLGLKVGSGRGTCQTTFPGESGRYQITLAAQTEREGQSPYRVSINGKLAGSGKFPFSQGELNCNCYRQPWQRYCPDVVMQLDVGTHQINTGDQIEFYGEEEYLCGKHGAYSKWRGMSFTPVN